MNKILPVFALVAIAIGGGSFYGGMKYGQTKKPAEFGNFQNLSAEERQQRMSQGGGQMKLRGQNGNGFMGGEIIAQDDKSITVKLPDGGSKIVLYSSATKITKSTEGAAVDLKTGENIMVNGQNNQDGTITAQSIQLTPKIINPVQ